MDKQMLLWREQGLTYQEIADRCGISKQRVHQIIGRVRKNNVDIESIVYKGVYDYMKENSQITYSTLYSKISGGNCSKNAIKNFRVFLHNSADEGKLNIKQIKRLIKLTGKSFEELFERRNDI